VERVCLLEGELGRWGEEEGRGRVGVGRAGRGLAVCGQDYFNAWCEGRYSWRDILLLAP